MDKEDRSPLSKWLLVSLCEVLWYDSAMCINRLNAAPVSSRLSTCVLDAAALITAN